MQRHRLLATSLLASVCTFAAAQAPATPLTQPNPMATLTTIDPPSSSPLVTVPAIQSAHTLTFSSPNVEWPKSFTFKYPKNNLNVLGLSEDARIQSAEAPPTQLAQIILPKIQPNAIIRDASPCYKLRVYGFTPPDLKSHHPRASTETDCTPASTSHVKSLQLQATPAPK